MKLLEAADNRRYRDVSLAGQGGHAYTFRARDSRNGNRLVAIKIPKNDPRGDKHRADTDIVDEGLKVAKLGSHDNIVRIHGFVKYDQEKRGLVMEFIEGGNLRDAIKNLTGDIENSVKIAAGVCRALMLAHEHFDPIVHRDVKPANILMSSHAVPKLTDFGIAMEPSNLPPVEVVGSLYYMAPEYLKDDGHAADPRSDLYSLTVVLFEMIEGRLPFYDDNTTGVINLIKNQTTPTLYHERPVALRRIVNKGLQKKPEDRYQTAREMLSDLEMFLSFYTEIYVGLEKFEAGLGLGFEGREVRTKKMLFLGERYLELAAETIGGIFAELAPEPQRTQLEIGLALLSIATEEHYRQAGGHWERIQGTDSSSDLEGIGKITQVLWKKLLEFGGKTDSQDAEPVALSEEQDLKEKVAEIEKLLNEEKIEEARSKAQLLLSREITASAHQLVAEIFYRKRIFDQAIKICEAALQEHEGHAELHAVLGKALFPNQRARAMQALRKAIELGTIDEEAQTLHEDFKQLV
jgi:hypothetical protein